MYLFDSLCFFSQLSIKIQYCFVLFIKTHIQWTFLYKKNFKSLAFSKHKKQTCACDCPSVDSNCTVNCIICVCWSIANFLLSINDCSNAWSCSVYNWRSLFHNNSKLWMKYNQICQLRIGAFRTLSCDVVVSNACKRSIVALFVLCTWRFSSSKDSRCSRNEKTIRSVQVKKYRFTLEFINFLFFLADCVSQMVSFSWQLSNLFREWFLK